MTKDLTNGNPMKLILNFAIPLLFGFLFNRSYAVWDYRGLPHNFHGQICPQYFCGWLGIALLAVFLDDGVRYLAFGEAIGPYCLF